MEEIKTLAQQLIEAQQLVCMVEEKISELFEEYDYDTSVTLDFHIGSDWYDNSIEIYFKNILPYPYEPPMEIRKAIYAMGFNWVYWNFIDEKGNYTEEIRGYEPRHYQNSNEWCYQDGNWRTCPYGYVDERFNLKEYELNYRKEKASDNNRTYTGNTPDLEGAESGA